MPFFDLPLWKRALALATAGALLPGAAHPAHAAPRQGAAARSAARGGAPAGARVGSYLLGSGDQIKVVVKDYPEFNVDNVTVPPDGVVSLPFYGTVRVGGKTTAQVEAQLRSILLHELKQPRVSVIITQFRDLTIGRVYLLGAVTTPGPIDIREGFRLTEVLAASGGLGGRLEEKSASLTRAGQRPVRLDLALALAQPNGAANVRLQPGDTLNIAAIAPGRVVVSGDVAERGTFEMHRDPQIANHELGLFPRLSDAILLAGGLGQRGASASTSDNGTGARSTGSGSGQGTSESAAPSGVAGTNMGAGIAGLGAGSVHFTGFLQRDGRRVELNVEEALRDVGGVYNIPLRPGDFITIEAVLPPAPIMVRVSGFVGRVGPLQVAPGTRLLQVLTDAGGLTKTPDKVEASVLRGTRTIAVNLPALLLNADSDANIELQAGDVVQISEPPIIHVRAAGSLTTPGELRLRPGSTLLDGLLEAGNLSIKPSDARISVLRHEEDGSQKTLSADAADLLELRSVTDNVVLREGDLIIVSPIRMQTVFVLGEVASPGAIEVREGEGLVELLTRAGGAKETAALSRIAVERNGQSLAVDALDAIKSGKPLDFTMQKGDKVVVPPNLNQVAVLEAVAKPGVYPIPERGRLTLADALALAGGPSQSTREIVLVRKVNGQPQEKKFPIREVRAGAAGQQVLQPGDAIYVPSTVAKPNLLQRILPALGLLNFIGR